MSTPRPAPHAPVALHAGAALLAIAMVLAAGSATPVRAEARVPSRMAAASVEEHVGAKLPLTLPFIDATGRRGRLADYLGDGRPLLLVLAYARCTMLCSMVLQSTADAVRSLATVVPGRDYRLLLVSIDPYETPPEAARKQLALVERIGFSGDPGRWPYLVGTAASVAQLADALGFRYAWDERTQQYAHPAVSFVITPSGRISRYLHGIGTSPEELAAALEIARQDELGTAALADVLRCFRFDGVLTRYGARIELWMRTGASLVFLGLVSLIVGLVLRERRRRS